MGHDRNTVIVVSSWADILLRETHKLAKEVFGRMMVTDIVMSPVNKRWSFMVGPDASKVGWEDEISYTEKRESFVREMEKVRYDDGSMSLKYVVVQFGDDNFEAKIIVSGDEVEKFRGMTKTEAAVSFDYSKLEKAVMGTVSADGRLSKHTLERDRDRLKVAIADLINRMSLEHYVSMSDTVIAEMLTEFFFQISKAVKETERLTKVEN